MNAAKLTDAVLASLVSRVTETMLGLQLAITPPPHPRDPRLLGRTAILEIPGPRPFLVALTIDDGGCIRLTSEMFSCAPSEVDDTMKNDTVGEILNMAAGQIKAALQIDQALGLPRVVDPTALAGDRWRRLRLHVENVALVISLADADAHSGERQS